MKLSVSILKECQRLAGGTASARLGRTHLASSAHRTIDGSSAELAVSRTLKASGTLLRQFSDKAASGSIGYGYGFGTGSSINFRE